MAEPLPVLIGESFVGEGAEAAHIDTVLGERHGLVGTAWATALATQRPGHSAFVTVLRPRPVNALANCAVGEPKVADMLAVRHAPQNPFFTPA